MEKSYNSAVDEAVSRIRKISEHTVTMLTHLGSDPKILLSSDKTSCCCNSTVLAYVSPHAIHADYERLWESVGAGKPVIGENKVSGLYASDRMLTIALNLDSLKDWYPRLTIGIEKCGEYWKNTEALTDERTKNSVASLFQKIADSVDWLSEITAKLIAERLNLK